MSSAIFIIFSIVVIPLIVVAIFLLNGKGAFLIAGYNTMSKAEKAKYDEKALSRFIGWLLIAILFFTLLIFAGAYFDITLLTYCGIVLTLVVTTCGLIYSNTGNRFCKSSNTEVSVADENSKSSTSKAITIAVISISLIVFIVVGVLLYQGKKEPVVHILDKGIQINAMYGLNINFSDITEISLIEKSMIDIGVGKRTNGYGGIGETLKGHFKSDKLEKNLLFVQSKSSPTIRIKRANKETVYISFHNSETTKQLYREMIATTLLN